MTSKVRTLRGSRTQKTPNSAKTIFEAQQEDNTEPIQIDDVTFNPATLQLYLESTPGLGDSNWMDILQKHDSLNPEMTRTMILIAFNMLKKIIDDFEIKHSFVNGVLKFQTADGDWSSDIDIASMVDTKIAAANIPQLITDEINTRNYIPEHDYTNGILKFKNPDGSWGPNIDIQAMVSAEVTAQLPP